MKLSIDPSIQKVPFYPKAALYGAGGDWVRLSSNENPFGPSPRAMEAISAALSEVNRYPESEFELKSLLAAKYGIKPQNVLIGNGSNEIIETSLKALKVDGRRKSVLVTDPSFAFYRIAASIYGYDVASLPLPSLHLDLQQVAEAVDEKTRVVFLCNPNNPTGEIFDDAAFSTFLASLPPEVLVVVDEAYAEFADGALFPGRWTTWTGIRCLSCGLFRRPTVLRASASAMAWPMNRLSPFLKGRSSPSAST